MSRHELLFVFNTWSSDINLIYRCKEQMPGVDFFLRLCSLNKYDVTSPLQASADITPYNTGRESTIWGISLMLGYLGYTLTSR